MVLVLRKTGKQNFFNFFYYIFRKTTKHDCNTVIFPKTGRLCRRRCHSNQFHILLRSVKNSLEQWSLPYGWCIGHNEEKVRGVTITEAQALWNFRGFAPVMGKVGFSRTCYNFCWAGGMWPRCMETGSRQWSCNGAAMEKRVVGGNLGSPRRA